jgi:formylglycine-generating enzyme required for sulfatase activity
MGEEGDPEATLHRNEALDYDYWIAQAPVTVAQFRQFVTASGYQPVGVHAGDLQAPDNRPIDAGFRRDALAFCKWLTERWRDELPPGWSVRLQSEAEWEKAARGGEHIPAAFRVTTIKRGLVSVPSELIDNPLPRRTYRWGEQFDAEKANVESTIGRVSAVGCYPGGVSPYGCDDMAGNVLEWTRSLWGRRDKQKADFTYPYDPEDRERERLDVEIDILRVTRGGSCFGDRDFARCAYRTGNQAATLIFGPPAGFRVVLRAAPVS